MKTVLTMTAPPPFGLHDLRLVVQIARELDIPTGVVINRDGSGDISVDEFCAAEGLPVLMRIPFDRAIAEGIARGHTLIDIQAKYAQQLADAQLAHISQRTIDALL